VGVGANGRRVLIAVIDGRQAGYSAGMSLRETATLLRDLGARDAINLDGGGSSAMVVWDSRAERQQLRVVNKPSDAIGERPVANALAIVHGCNRK
jgi:exopolysaccharide biosynthesis protein